MTVPDNKYTLTSDERTAFVRDGYLLLRNRIPQDTIDAIYGVFSQALDSIALRWRARRLIADTLSGLPLDERYLRLLKNENIPVPAAWRRILVSEPIFELWQLPELLGAVRTIIGNEVHAHGVWNGRPRDPFGRSHQVNWHQDAYYYKHWSANQSPLISAWIPLVPVDEHSACMQFIAGSHQFGWVTRKRLPNGEYGAADIDIEDADPRLMTARMAPGDVVLFTDTTLHQSTPNSSNNVRWSIDIRFARAGLPVAELDRRGYLCFSATAPESIESYSDWRKKYNYEPEELLEELTNFEEGYDLTALRAFSKSSAFSDVY